MPKIILYVCVFFRFRIITMIFFQSSYKLSCLSILFSFQNCHSRSLYRFPYLYTGTAILYSYLRLSYVTIVNSPQIYCLFSGLHKGGDHFLIFFTASLTPLLAAPVIVPAAAPTKPARTTSPPSISPFPT